MIIKTKIGVVPTSMVAVRPTPLEEVLARSRSREPYTCGWSGWRTGEHGAARRDRLQTTLHAGTGRARRRLDLQLLSRREAEGERRDGEHPAKGRRTGEEAGGPALPACGLHERVRLRPCALRSSQHKNFGRFLANAGVRKRISGNCNHFLQ